MTQRADDIPQGPSGFATTQWSLVLRAGAEHAAESALVELCSRYWYPVYAFVRRQSASASDAQDVTLAIVAGLALTDRVGRRMAKIAAILLLLPLTPAWLLSGPLALWTLSTIGPLPRETAS
jgi:hypothetical protein